MRTERCPTVKKAELWVTKTYFPSLEMYGVPWQAPVRAGEVQTRSPEAESATTWLLKTQVRKHE
jgi:hypothetical protein